MKIKVFNFILDHRIGGPHVYVGNLMQELDSDIESYLVTTGRGLQTDISLINLRHWLRWLYPLEVILNVLSLCWRFRRPNSRSFILFDVHGAANLAPLVAARILNIPVVWHFHETLGDFIKLAVFGKKIVSALPHVNVVVAQKAAAIFKISDSVLIPGAVDPYFWSLIKPETFYQKGEQRFRILCVGNLNPLKGFDLLLTALEAVEQPWELIIVGAELNTFLEYSRNLREQADRLKSSSRLTHFVGWQSPEEVRRLMVSSDVFVLPSRSEACPLVLLEAMAASCVCIATDVGDVREILDSEGCGIVIPSESTTALTEALDHVYKMDNAARERMGKSAKKVILERYSLKKQAEKHLYIYKKLVKISKGVA